MDSKSITAADVRKAIVKRQIDFLTPYIVNGDVDPVSGILTEVSSTVWVEENQMKKAKVLEETWEAIYNKYGVYIDYNSDNSIVIRIFPANSEILKTYPIKETQIWKKSKEKIRECLFGNNLFLTNMFVEFLMNTWSIVTKEEWLDIQKNAINKCIAEMNEKGLAQNKASTSLYFFSSEAIEYAQSLGFEVERLPKLTYYEIQLKVPNTTILTVEDCIDSDPNNLGWFE